MKAKDIRFGSETIKRLIRGVETLANAVGSTLGPGGRNVIYKNNGWPYVTKDGVTVARNISLPDEFENIGVQMVKEVANRTCKDAGDGTSTSSILAHAILTEGFKHIEHGINPIDIQRSINHAVEVVVDYIHKNIRKDINDDASKIMEIATVSANWDYEIGDMVGKAVSKVGIDGAVHIDNSRTSVTRLDLVEGVNFDRGLDGTSPYFINDQVKRNVEFENPYILLYRGTMKSFRNLIPLLEQVMKNNAEIVIIADGYEPDVLSSLVANKQSGKIKVAAIKAPHFSDLRIDTMNDLAIAYGTEVIDEQFGNKILSQVSLADLGRCKKVIIDAKGSSFIGVNVAREIIDNHIKVLKEQRTDLDETSLLYTNLTKRIAQLTGYIATIYIGASSEIEFEEKYDRLDDALRATRSALEEGIVPGGSYSYIKAIYSPEFNSLLEDKTNGASYLGASIVKNALLRPFMTLCSNAGIWEGEIYPLIKEVADNKSNDGVGYNIKTRKLENLWDAGVIDPYKVTRTALQNAASVAGLMLTSNVVIGDFVEEPPISQTNNPPNLF
jgi:chaperonin GroEL